MKNVLLIDFGSTYTKLTAVDVDEARVLGTASAYTTVETDINDGLRNGLSALESKIGKLMFSESYACSSAAGGLKMITSGLVPELTGEAARLASLGAGAKVIGVYAFELTCDDLTAIQEADPDIFLLVGGTDGGNTDCILHNARALASLHPSFPIVVAGNRTAAKDCRDILSECEVYVCPNVMPKFGELRIEDTQKQIREIFLNKIVQAKGLSKATELLSDILMPTPAAVLQAVELLSKGCDGEAGLGELLAVDVGGATTDVYSVADGMPDHMSTVYKGLPEPYAKRTVEGDIGMRYSVHGIVEAVGVARISALSGLSPETVEDLAADLRQHPDKTPTDDNRLEALDHALACCAVDEAVGRHAGTVSESFTLLGKVLVQEGKNLTGVKHVIATGGSLIHSANVVDIAKHALYSVNSPASLRPIAADIWADETYILAAMGLLSSYYPETALKIMKKELKHYGHSE